MAILIIGGSSQLAFHIISSASQKYPNQSVYATFRSHKSYNLQLSQLKFANVNFSNLCPVIIKDLSEDFFINFFDKHPINEVYFLQAINVPSTQSVNNLNELFYNVQVRNSLVLLEALKFFPKIKTTFTLSSKMFRNTTNQDKYVDIHTLPDPDNVYGATKLECWNYIKKYRSDYGTAVHAAILFNFESNHRLGQNREHFVIHKITKELVEIKKNKLRCFSIQNFFDRADWSHALDICNAIMNIAGTREPRDYIIGSGIAISLADLISDALRLIDDQFLEKYCNELIGESPFTKPCLIADNHDAEKILYYERANKVSTIIYESYRSRIKS